MVKKKSTSIAWPYTPEPSPRLEATVSQLQDVPEHFIMSEGEFTRARPISVTTRKDGLMSPGNRPTLEDVLNNKAPSPYTLAAYTAFLSQQHCLETLEFTTESKKYADKYDEAAAGMAGMPLTIETQQGWELIQDWQRILEIYVKPGAPREINLPSEERDDLIERSYDFTPPRPEHLDAAVKRMYDLMSDSIFIPFCNSLKQVPYAQTYNVMSDYDDPTDLEPARLTFDERSVHRRMPSRRRRSPPNTSAGPLETSRSPPQQHRPTQSSSLSSALGRQGGARLSTHISHSSAISESALTDSSGGPESPPAGELLDHEPIMTPPTTPPTSELGGTTSHGSASGMAAIKTQRSESGGWKKAMKIFSGGKKKNGSNEHE
ncbi:regulator of G protein signaling domain protein [Cladophialophora carrionii]|uniref:Regulator of G protein signaling domain protein n=1 Tax=Cladophialophora carrionii TaxID=86049 RepID=A0A1C1CUN5_9EURO|nr:regulator of G protein signaling domain protein [Cladophialophora carrionii]